MLDRSTFEYLKPTDKQIAEMATCRRAAALYAATIEGHVPDGPDKTYVLRRVRETAMWVNVAITRHHDGRPRED